MENKTQAREVQQMFTQIAPHYDFMNCLMTVNLDTSWRSEVINLTQLPLTGSLLDLGSGTGKLAKEALKSIQMHT